MSAAKGYVFNPDTFSGYLYSPSSHKPGGPATPQGKAIAARNATAHGLFARDVVLPHLGEDPDAYNTLYLQFCEQLDPRTLLERHYVEAIAAASWRLRRLHRWQAQVYEDDTLTEDARLDKLDRVLRHETALHRQINASVRLLGRDVPELFEGRARKRALSELDQTERVCRTDDAAEREVSILAEEYMQFSPLPATFDRTSLDNTHEEVKAAAPAEVGKCQNEPGTAQSEAPLPNGPTPQASREPDMAPDRAEKCRNEPAEAHDLAGGAAAAQRGGLEAYRERLPALLMP